MLTEKETKMLEFLNNHLLANFGEIKAHIGEEPDGAKSIIHSLISSDCVKMVEPIGVRCYVITPKGTKALSEAKKP